MTNNGGKIPENQGIAYDFADRFLDWLLPPLCPVTGEGVEKQGMLAPQAWARLRFIAPPFCGGCGVPLPFAVDDSSDAVRCAPCLQTPPAFDAARASFVYDDDSRDLILRFKHADHTYIVRTLVPLMIKAGQDFWTDDPLMVPVPLHRWRLLRRRYNQAALLAQGLARAQGLTYAPGLLRRVRSTPTQGRMKAAARQENVRKAFSLAPGATLQLQGRAVVLIDDVLTTGATVNECARVLQAAGAGPVRVLTAVRTLKE